MPDQTDPTTIHILASGPVADVAYAVTQAGRMPAREFLQSDEAPLKDKAVLTKLFEMLTTQHQVHNEYRFKKVRGQIWECKSYQVRIGAFRHGRVWFLTHGFIKKRDKWQPEQIKRAETIRKEHLSRNAE
jgi:hypothetical protein